MNLRRSVPFLLAAATAFTVLEARAQVPDGWYVVSSFYIYDCSTFPACQSEHGRLFFVHPRSPSTVTPPIEVTGLGCDLTGGPACAPGITQGASCVLRRPSDGALIVGELAPAGASVDLHVLTLAGAAVSMDVPYSVGIAGPGGTIGIVQSALLPNGDILVGVDGIVAGPLAGSLLGLVSPPTGAVTPISVVLPVTTPPGARINAATATLDGMAAYFGMFADPAPGLSSIYGVPLAGGTPTATLLATIAGLVSNLAVDDAGQIVASCLSVPPPDNLVRIDPVTGFVTPIGPPTGMLNGVAMERVTGNYALVSGNAAPPYPPGTVWSCTPAGAATQLTFFYLGWWGAKSGIDVNPDPEAYGTGTCANKYAWALAPNPGGLPEVGNLGFSLTVTSAGSAAPGLMAMSLASANSIALGVDVLVDLAQLVAITPHAGTIHLPIPPLASLLGVQVFAQSFHADACAPFGIAGSAGVKVTVL